MNYVIKFVAYQNVQYLQANSIEFNDNIFTAARFTKEEADEKIRFYSKTEFNMHGFVRAELYKDEVNALKENLTSNLKAIKSNKAFKHKNLVMDINYFMDRLGANQEKKSVSVEDKRNDAMNLLVAAMGNDCVKESHLVKEIRYYIKQICSKE